MRLKSILNRVEKHKSFVYERVKGSEGPLQPSLKVEVRARSNSRPRCSGCGEAGPGYDAWPAREFEFVPLWGIQVFLVYALRRVQCRRCGVKVETVPWAQGKQTLTRTYRQFLATWARRLSWQEVARSFRTSWDQVFRSVAWMVEWGIGPSGPVGNPGLGGR